MNLLLIDTSLALRLVILALALSLAGCKSDSESAQATGDLTNQPSTTLLSQVMINDYVVVSTRRVGRTITEYTLRAIATNTSSTRYTNVAATLTSVPPHITIVDNSVTFGTVVGNSNTTSADEFIIAVDLSVNTSLLDLVWRVDGTIPGTGGGGGGGSPSQVGIFMSIDDNANIKGESISESHQDWIELLSFSEGSSVAIGSTSGSTRPSVKVNLEGVTVSKLMDISSPKLRLALAEGDIFTDIKIDIIKSCNGSPYTEYAITLTVSSLTALQMSSATPNERPTENLSFNYSRIETMYTPVGPGCKFEAPIYSYQDAIGIK
jgi:type VI secretion system Hcp family effector